MSTTVMRDSLYNPREYSFDELETAMLLKEREVASQLNIKPCTVRAERLRGAISYVRIHHRYYYTQEHIDEYIAAHSTRAEHFKGAPKVVLLPVSPVQTAGNHSVGRRETSIPKDREAIVKLARETFARPKRSPT